MESREEIVREVMLDLRAVVDALKYPSAEMIDDWDKKYLQPLLASPELIAVLVTEVGKRRKKSNFLFKSLRQPYAERVDDSQVL